MKPSQRMSTAERVAIATLGIATTLLAPCGATADGIILWNKLGSDAEVLDSAYGPDLVFYTGGGGIDVAANHMYVPGYFPAGGAIAIDDGPYFNMARVHNVVWNNLSSYLNPNRGMIDAWYQQSTDPVAYDHNPYRIFDGSFGLNSGMMFESQGDGVPAPRLRFGLNFGVGHWVEVYSRHDGLLGCDISAHNGTWIHVAALWDRYGIGGSADTLRLYVNGALQAASTDSSWGSSVGQRADICSGNDANIAHKFRVDNLKVWDYAALDGLAHRHEETWIPEPSTLMLLALAGLTAGRRGLHRPGAKRAI